MQSLTIRGMELPSQAPVTETYLRDKYMQKMRQRERARERRILSGALLADEEDGERLAEYCGLLLLHLLAPQPLRFPPLLLLFFFLLLVALLRGFFLYARQKCL